MEAEERRIRQRLKDDFRHFADRCLKIRTKEGRIQPLELNRAQLYIHERLEAQLKQTGMIRALILKGRQQGCSTYIEGRYYWKVTHRFGVRAYILTHEDPATQNLFEMAYRYHEHNHPLVKPVTGSASAKELHFPILDSGYKVGTAGTKGTGRSGTYQFFHGSEVAFWANAESHAMGVIQAVPDIPGTECVLESTANGIGNYYHSQWQLAEAGLSDYIAIFIPWYWQPEYTKSLPDDWMLTDEEVDLLNKFIDDGLTEEHLCWRRAKIVSFTTGGESGDWKFKQEYPFTAAEAFQTSGDGGYILPKEIMDARKDTDAVAAGAKVVGVDPARYGDDRTSIAWRQGRVWYKKENHIKKSTMEVAGICAKILDADREIAMMFIDVGGLGAGIYDRLVELNYGSRITPVNFGERALNYDAPTVQGPDGKQVKAEENVDRRAEMYREAKKWLNQKPCKIPDEDSIQADACVAGFSYDSKQRLRIESKKDIRKRGMRSPDEWDAFILTFAEPVQPKKHGAFRQPTSSVA